MPLLKAYHDEASKSAMERWAAGKGTTKVKPTGPWLARVIPSIGIGGQMFSTANMHHGSRGLQEPRLSDMMAGFFALDRCTNVGFEFRIAGSASQPSIQVVLDLAEETSPDLSI